MENGVHQRKAYSIKFPNSIEPELMRHFIRGYFDGDGSVYLVKKGPFGNIIRTGFVSNSFQFINALRQYLIELGFNPTKLCLTEKSYRMNLGRKAEMIKLKNYFYHETPDKLYLTRKYEKFLNIDDGKNNPHLNKFTKEFRQEISNRIKTNHQLNKYSRYKECIITDNVTEIQTHKRSIKEACEEIGINGYFGLS